MIKRFVILLSIVIILVSSFFVYVYIKDKNLVIKTVYQAIPLDASLILETRKTSKLFNKLQNESEVWNELINIPAFQKLNSQISFLDSLIQYNPELEKITHSSSNLFSIHKTGKKNIDLIYYLNVSQVSNKKSITDVILKIFENYGTFKKRAYNDVPVYSAKGKEIKSFSFCVSKGIFILSYSPILLEEAIRQLSTSISIDNQKGFKKVKMTTGKNVEANIYLNCRTFPRLVSIFLEQNSKNYIKDYTHFANWVELDLNINSDVLLLNGFTFSNDSADNYLNIFLGQEPQEIEAGSIIPADVSAFFLIGLSDFELYRTKYKEYLDAKGRLKKYSDLKELSKSIKKDVEKLFYSFLEKEFGLVITDINGLNDSQNIFTVFKTKGKSIAKENLLEIIGFYAKKQHRTISAFTHKYKIDSETTIEIYKLPVEHLTEKIFGNLFSKAEDEYFTFIDNYLIFGKTKEALAKFVHYSILNKTLSTDKNFNEYTEYFASQSNFHFYTSLTKPSDFVFKYLNNDLQEGVKQNSKTFEKFPAFSFQFSIGKELIYNNLVLKYSSEVKESAHTLWESYLDSTIQLKPKLVINHYTQGKEIFVQDLKNNLYLINSVGRTLWKKPVREKIISDVYQIDFYKNNKLQVLFSTKNYIYLIDRNGNYVENYPVKLASPATNGISLFDYEKKKNYRIFVACENKKVYAFDKKGNTIKGWEFGTTDHHVYSPIQHFLVEDKDYIVFADKVRIYIVDRRGRERVTPAFNFSKSLNNSFFIEKKTDKTNARLVTTDPQGIIHYIYFNGKIEKVFVKKYSPNHYFKYENINSDQYKDFIFVDNNILDVINSNKKVLFSYTFTNEIDQPPACYEFSRNNMKVGVVNKAEGNIYLFNSNGKLYKGFPLKGKTLFSIGNLNKSMNKFNLVVGYENNLLYNYTVQ